MPSKSLVLSALVLMVISGFIATAPALAAGKERVLYRFCSQPDCTDGAGSVAALILDAVGNLYGTTSGGGAYGAGTVFQLTPGADGTWTEEVLYSFCYQNDCHDGYEPGGNLIFDAHGNLYGTTLYGGYEHNPFCEPGCGTVFKLRREANGMWTEKVLHKFGASETDGIYPVGGLVFDAAGNLYGTTATDEAGFGTVFQLSPGQQGEWTETVLHSFSYSSDGANPFAGPTIDASGNLYGTTSTGGPGCCGTVFRLGHRHGEWTFSVIHSFNGTDGSGPESAVILDSAGNVYGTTTRGGVGCEEYDCGTVFELTPGAKGRWDEKVLRSFHQLRYPEGGVVLDAAGNLYGTTPYGGRFRNSISLCGDSGCGTAFELSPDVNGKWSETTLHSFGGHADGLIPTSGLIFDASGNLYGTTEFGGAYESGTVFELTQ